MFGNENNEEIEVNKLTENEIKLERLEQRKYIRENLAGSAYFYNLAGIDRDNVVDELEVVVSEDGYDKASLDAKINEQNSIMRLFAIQQGREEEFNNVDEHSDDADNQQALKEIIELFDFSKGKHQGGRFEEVEEVRELSDHEKVLQEIRELREQQAEFNMTPEEKAAKAKSELRDGINKLMGFS